jgi:hypothetical protein
MSDSLKRSHLETTSSGKVKEGRPITCDAYPLEWSHSTVVVACVTHEFCDERYDEGFDEVDFGERFDKVNVENL